MERDQARREINPELRNQLEGLSFSEGMPSHM